MNEILVSVIIPVYNGRRFVSEAVNSALSQTWRNLEVVVVDDCSTDGTFGQLQAEFAGNQRVRILRNIKNSERSVSRNKGAASAVGNFLFFLDYDDLWRPNYIETVLSAFTPKVDIIYSFPRTFVDKNGNIVRKTFKGIDTDTGVLVFSSNVGYPSASAFRKGSFSGFNENLNQREDWEIFLRSYLDAKHIVVLDQDLVLMRSHGDRSSRSVKFWSSTITVSEQYIDKVPENYRGCFFYHLAEVCFRYGDLPRGWMYCFCAMASRVFPNYRIIFRLICRGIRLDRYFLLFGERKDTYPVRNL